MPTLPVSRRASRNERLDRLPFTRKHGRMLFGSGIGWALDAMDVGPISFIMAALATQWDLDSTTLGVIGSIGFVGMAIGATLGGLIADRIGRRQVFAITLLVYGLATGAAALSTGVLMLLILRFVIGLGLGAELPVASTLVSEFAPRRIRGRVVVWLEAFWALGWIAAACVGTFIIPLSDNGWRWAFAIGMVPAFYAIVVRWGLPESVRFLESKGRLSEAERIVREFENAAGVANPTPGPETQAIDISRLQQLDEEPAPSERPWIWSRGFRKRTGGLWTIWFCINLSYYGAFIWIPSLLVAQGYDLVKSFTFTLIITLAQLPGYAVSAWLIEVWGRRATLATFMLGSAAAAAFFGMASGEAMIITAGCLLSFFNLGAWGALYAIGPELYPTNIRGQGTGAAAGFGRIASIIAPFVVPLLIVTGGQVAAFAIFAAAFAIGAAAVALLPELKGAPSLNADRELLIEHVLRCVEQVGVGRVAAYGVIGRIVGAGPRQVGALMHRHGSAVPWWRITNAAGDLPPGILERALPHWQREGIAVKPNGRGCRYQEYAADEDAVAAAYARAVADLPPLARA